MGANRNRYNSQFRHIVAGMSWPYLDKPGVIVVLKTHWDPTDKSTPYWVEEIAHEEQHRLPEMFRLAAEMHRVIGVDEWWGDAMNEAVAAILYGQELGCEPIPLAPAPYIDHKVQAKTMMYLQILREMQAPDRCVLKYSAGSKLPAKIKEYPLADKKPVEQYPALAALCYAASALHLWLQLQYVKPRKTLGQTIIERAENRGQGEDYFPWGDDDGIESQIIGIVEETGGMWTQ